MKTDAELHRIVKESHYAPANNMWAFYMTAPKNNIAAALRDAYQRTAADMAEQISVDDAEYPPGFNDRFIRWYRDSCELLIRDIEAGKKIHQDYPKFVI